MSSPIEPDRRHASDEWSAPQPYQPTSASDTADQPGAGHEPTYTQPTYTQPTPSTGPGYAAYGTAAVQAETYPGQYQLPGSAPYTMPATAVPYSGAEQPKRGRGRRVVIGAFLALVIAAAGGVAGAAAIGIDDRNNNTTTTASTSGTGTQVQTVVNSPNTSITSLVSAVDPVVVSLTVKGNNEEDEGSGIVLQSDGVILTNNHVISAAENGGTVEVTFTDGKTASATIVAADAGEDLAIVKASGVSGLATATLGDSSTVKVGDTVVAIGNELGLSNSVSSGIVSALNRKVSVAADTNTPMTGGSNYTGQNSSGTTYTGAIQTDAAINEGDSGGALFNMQGQVIGIDSAIATGDSGSSGSVGIGFAIAINDAKAFIASNT